MKVGKMDGFCVGEPWNARAIADGIGYTAINTQDIWKDHPEKVCAFTAEFAEKNPKTVKAVLKALHEASVWLDDMKNRPEQARSCRRPTYINCPKELILGRMQGKYDFGDGRKKEDPNYMIFSERNCNYPQPKYAMWWLTQFRRWGMVAGAPDYEGVAKQVMRTRHLRRGDEGDRLQARRPRQQARDALRRRHVRSRRSPRSTRRSFAVKNLQGLTLAS